jgi:hypothetical protein
VKDPAAVSGLPLLDLLLPRFHRHRELCSGRRSIAVLHACAGLHAAGRRRGRALRISSGGLQGKAGDSERMSEEKIGPS